MPALTMMIIIIIIIVMIIIGMFTYVDFVRDGSVGSAVMPRPAESAYPNCYLSNQKKDLTIFG